MTRLALLLAAGIPLVVVGHAAARANEAGAPVPARYDVSVRVQPDARRLELSGTVQLPAVDTTRAQIVFRLNPRISDFRVDWTEPGKHTGNAITLQLLSTDSVTTKRAVRPAKAIPPNTPVALHFSAIGSGDFAQLYYVGPEVAFGSAWGAEWYPVLQGDRDRCVGTLNVTVPPGWSVVTGGARRSTETEERAGTFRVAVDDPTYFTFLAGPYITVRHGGAVPLSAHLLTQRDNMPNWLDGTERMLEVLVAEFGPYAFDSLAVVEVPRDIAQRAGFNAFSAQGVLALNHRAFGVPDTKLLLEWLGHELSHQWYPHIVQFDTPPGYFMEEAMAEYGGLRIVETIGGPEAATRLRRTGYEYDPIYSALAYFRLVGAGVDAPIGNLEPRESSRNLAYTKGALVLDMLSRELGPDTMRRVLNDISRRHGLRRVPWPTFLEEIERGAGRDLNWFYEQWFHRTGAPDFALTWKQEGDQLLGRITQPAPFYRANLSAEARGPGSAEKATHVVTIDGTSVDFAMHVPFRVTRVELDPAYEILRWTPEYRAAADSVRSVASGK